MKNMKKLLCAVMAATTVCSMSVSAFAVAVTGSTATLGASGSTKPMTLDLDIPSKIDFVVDPFNRDKKGQIQPPADTVYEISSKTLAPIKVMVTQCQGTATTGSGGTAPTLTSSQPAASTTAKQAQLFLRASGSLTAKLDTSSRYNAATATKAGDVIVTTAGSTNALLVEIPASDGTTPKGTRIGITGFTTTNDKWTGDDAFSVNVALNLQLQPVA